MLAGSSGFGLDLLEARNTIFYPPNRTRRAFQTQTTNDCSRLEACYRRELAPGGVLIYESLNVVNVGILKGRVTFCEYGWVKANLTYPTRPDP